MTNGKTFRHAAAVKTCRRHTHVFLLPLAEVDLEGGHGELLAHAPLVVDRFRDQGGILRAVAAGGQRSSRN